MLAVAHRTPAQDSLTDLTGTCHEAARSQARLHFPGLTENLATAPCAALKARTPPVETGVDKCRTGPGKRRSKAFENIL